jgi:N-methylhydantoinase A/oxoprolinase/acetone carboxylase beta subunit
MDFHINWIVTQTQLNVLQLIAHYHTTMSKYIIGIDTGGTYTDAVLLNIATKEIIATAKEPTTHYQLALSIGRVLTSLLGQSGIDKADISRLALSTTLATNAIVEGKGARVAAFIIGYVKHFRLPITATIFVKGGHSISGLEEEALDIDTIVDTIQGLRNDVDAYAICSAMSMANASHELVTEKAISMLDPKPVFCSHTVSQHTGMRERAATAALHAKLMPLMEDFIEGVQEAMCSNKLQCPVSLITGNGAQIDIADATKQAGTTVASGPACTAGFGAFQGVDQALVVDVGGTTTDIAMVEDGQMLLSKDGSQIGRWQTHLEAVDMFTGGIGGDSHVVLDRDGNISLGPSRVIPLAMAPGFPGAGSWLGAELKAKCIALLPEVDSLKDDDPILYALMAGPATADSIRLQTGFSGVPLNKRLEQLSRSQVILETGFTPTDALHVLDTIEIGDRDRAEAGATALATLIGMDATRFSEKIIELTEERIENLLIEYVIHRYWGKSLSNFVSTRNDHPVLGVEFSMKLPLIGVGAAARYFLPRVAKRLGTTVEFPEYCEVGNGVGAALLGCDNSLRD